MLVTGGDDGGGEDGVLTSSDGRVASYFGGYKY